jgi:hypothetical protein
MKKIILPLSIFFALSGTVFSQGIYLRAGTGYGLPVATSVLGEKDLNVYDPSSNDPYSYSNTVVTSSYGSGFDFNFALGYKFNENFIFDLNVQYLIGNKVETSNTYIDKELTYPGTEETITNTNIKGFLFNPAFIFSAGFGKAAPYGRFGVVIASPTITQNDSYYYDLDGINTRERTWVYNKGFGLGYQAAVGMNWKLTDKMDIYTEANFISMTFYPAEGNVTKYISDGNDLLDQLTVSQKQLKFEKTYDPQPQYDPESPTVVARKAFPLSSLSAQVGIRFTIWKKAD